METGLHENVPFADYLKIDAISNTAMGAAAISPLHYKHAQPLETARYLTVGNMVHTQRLEPAKFRERYAVCPAFQNDAENFTTTGKTTSSKATNYYKEKVAEFMTEQESQGREVVDQSWYDETLAVVNALYLDGHANAIFNTRGPFELTVIWDDDTGLRCKARLDKVCTHQGKFCDLKTCQDILSFPRSFGVYSYARQMAHYAAGYKAITGEWLEPWICAIEKSSPYCVHTAPVAWDAMDWGRSEQQRILRMIAHCREHDVWPGPPAPSAWVVPEWQIEQSAVRAEQQQQLLGV